MELMDTMNLDGATIAGKAFENLNGVVLSADFQLDGVIGAGNDLASVAQDVDVGLALETVNVAVDGVLVAFDQLLNVVVSRLFSRVSTAHHFVNLKKLLDNLSKFL